MGNDFFTRYVLFTPTRFPDGSAAGLAKTPLSPMQNRISRPLCGEEFQLHTDSIFSRKLPQILTDINEFYLEVSFNNREKQICLEASPEFPRVRVFPVRRGRAFV